MAKYIPDGWRCSPRGSQALAQKYDQIINMVRAISHRYRHLTYPAQDDFYQEGLLAATYAIDTHNTSRGKLEAYIQCVVSNALAMVAAEASAMSRSPKLREWNGSEWVRVSAFTPLDPETIQSPIQAETITQAREDAISSIRQQEAGRRRIEALKAKLPSDSRLILDLKMDTPLELQVLSRNLNGRNKLTNLALSRYTGLTLSRVEKSLREIRAVAKATGLERVNP